MELVEELQSVNGRTARLGWLHERSRVFRAAVQALLWIFIALIAFGGLSKMFDDFKHCVPGRYIDC